MARYCDHEFHIIELADGGLKPATLMCAYCGQVRHLHGDGRVKIFIDEGKIEKQHNANPSDTNNSAARG